MDLNSLLDRLSEELGIPLVGSESDSVLQGATYSLEKEDGVLRYTSNVNSFIIESKPPRVSYFADINHIARTVKLLRGTNTSLGDVVATELEHINESLCIGAHALFTGHAIHSKEDVYPFIKAQCN